MKFERASGVLLHPTSFPGPYGIGDLGGVAYRFVDFLQQTGQKLWQILPLNPTGYGDSPYTCFSAFAGNPLLISPDILLGQGFLDPADLQNVPGFPWERVDYGAVQQWKMELLNHSYELFQQRATPEVKAQLAAFEQANAGWLEDYALFMAAKSANNGALWTEWDKGLALRDPAVLAEWREKLAGPIAFQKYIQYIFFDQWLNLKRYANERDVKIVGDIPIFVAYDSSDVWAHPELFYVNETGQQTFVAGVPPDFFSPTGQRWGNPLYRWKTLTQTDYTWWIERFRLAFQVVDIVRLDHFRAFDSYWEVPAEEETALNGRWVRGPGAALFKAVFQTLGEKPVIVEDLGSITPAVKALRDELGFPGMRILQFAFDGKSTHPYLPHNYISNTLVYTGTHDNNTTTGWYNDLADYEKERVLRYLGASWTLSPGEVTWQLVRLAWASVADLAIAPLQDLLGIGSEGRMNKPGFLGGNWDWRYHPDSLSDWLRSNLSEITLLFGRSVPPGAEQEEEKEPEIFDAD